METNAPAAAGDTMVMLQNYVPSLFGAVVLLVAGWFVAMFLSRLVEQALQRTDISTRIADAIADEDGGEPQRIEYWIGRGVFCLLILFVLVGFFQVLGVTQVTEPIVRFLNEIFEYAPRLIGPALLVLIAWVLAKFLRIVVRRALRSSQLDERLQGELDAEDARPLSLSDTLADAVYWLTLLVFLPAVLSALDLGGLLEPVRGVVNTLLGYLPNLLAAGVILVVGWFVARILRRLVTNMLSAMGTDRLGAQIGLEADGGRQSLSALAGLVVYVLVFLPVLIGALNALSIDAVTRPVSDMLSKMLTAIPHVFAGALLVVVAFIAGRIVAGLVAGLLAGAGFDRVPEKIGFRSDRVAGSRSLSEIAGQLVLIAILLFACIEALVLMDFQAFAELVGDFVVFAARILFGIAIVGVGILLGRLVADFVRSANPPQVRLLAVGAQAAVVVLTSAIGLQQMGVGADIISLAFGLTLGAIAVAAAIAFGFGGRDAAGEIVADWRRRLGKGSPD